MRSLTPLLIVSIMALAAAEAAAETGVAFAAGPRAVREGANVKIGFAVTTATDVEVAIVDAAGRVVRRLAAGMLGDNPPPPLVRGLSQEIAWDCKDDAGVALDPRGGYKVRVSAGLAPSGDGTAFGAPAAPGTVANVIGLAAGADGRVYVMSEPWNRAWWRSTAMHVFKPTGEYERTVKPFPGETPSAKVAGLTGLSDENGRAVPVVYRVLAMSYYPHEDVPQHFAIATDGKVHFLTHRSSYWKDREGEKWLASIAADGSLAYPAYAGARIEGQTGVHDPYLAAASDGQSVFATGLAAGKGDKAARPNLPAVYRIDLPARQEARVFFGDPANPGSDDKSLGDPRGVATDGKGQLFVADRANNRILIVDEKSGARVNAVRVDAPTWLAVGRTSGVVYVVSGGEIVKFGARPSQAAGYGYHETGRVKLPELTGRDAAGVRRSFALSESSAGGVALWVGASRGPNVLLRCEEQGGKFGEWKPAGCEPAFVCWNIAAGLDGRTVGCKVGSTLRLLDEETGATRDLRLQGSGGQTYRLGPDNQIYGMDHATGLLRWDANGKQMPFAGGTRLGNRPSGTTSWERDFDIDRAGNIYIKQRGKAYHGRMTVDKYDKDGNKLKTVVWAVSDGAYGPRIDGAGNLYMADIVKPVGQVVPDFFEGKLPDAPVDSKGNVLGQYQWMYGSVIKFTPAGGAVWFPRNVEVDAYAFDGEAQLPADQTKVGIEIANNGGGSRVTLYPAELQGAAWFRYGCSYVLDMHVGHNRRCHCTATEIDVDDYGRVVYTDQGRFRVVMLDAAGNRIATIGRYGNQDSPVTGAGDGVGFNWFTGLGLSDRYVYVADGGNHRVVRVALNYAVRAACPIEEAKEP